MESAAQEPDKALDTARAAESKPSGEDTAPDWLREIGQVIVDGLNRMRTDEAYRREIASRTK